jgi:hypothetical protein
MLYSGKKTGFVVGQHDTRLVNECSSSVFFGKLCHCLSYSYPLNAVMAYLVVISAAARHRCAEGSGLSINNVEVDTAIRRSACGSPRAPKAAPPSEKNIGRISQRFAHFCKNFAVCSFSAKT